MITHDHLCYKCKKSYECVESPCKAKTWLVCPECKGKKELVNA